MSGTDFSELYLCQKCNALFYEKDQLKTHAATCRGELSSDSTVPFYAIPQSIYTNIIQLLPSNGELYSKFSAHFGEKDSVQEVNCLVKQETLEEVSSEILEQQLAVDDGTNMHPKSLHITIENHQDLEEDGEEYLPPGKRGRFSSSFSKEEQDQRLATYEKEVIVNDKGEQCLLYVCHANGCKYTTRHIRHFDRHKRTNHKPDPEDDLWRCELCDFTSLEKTRLQAHVNTHTKPYVCGYCEKRFGAKRDRDQHQLRHTGDYAYVCDQCDYKTRQSKMLKEHRRKHTGDLLRCSQCSFQTAYTWALQNHVANKHVTYEELRYACTLCEYRTGDRGTFARHQKMHLGRKDYKCSLCEYRAITKELVVKHMRRHNQDKMFRCNRCDYSTAHGVCLKNHIRSHLNNKPFQCPLCDYCAVDKAKVERHLAVKHENEENLKAIDLGTAEPINLNDYKSTDKRFVFNIRIEPEFPTDGLAGVQDYSDQHNQGQQQVQVEQLPEADQGGGEMWNSLIHAQD